MAVVDRDRVLFGIFPIPEAARAREVLDLVREADRRGLDLIGIQDHPYQRRFLDAFTLLAMLAGQTSRVRLFPDVANLPLRGPAMLAKAAASIDVLSGGRFELGMGAGGFWEAIRGMGGPSRAPAEALEALEEAIRIIRLLWSGHRGLRFEGKHYEISGIHSGPVPVHDMALWVGGSRPRMLRLIGRLADGVVVSSPYVPPAQLPRLHESLDEAAASAGRDPASIRRIYNVSGRITDGASEGFLDGPPDQWVEELTDLATTHRIDAFVLWMTEESPEQVRRFAEVAAKVRAATARAGLEGDPAGS